MKYSHRGHLLAVAGAAPGGSAGSSSIPFAPVGGTSPYAATSYSVRLFDPDTGVEVWSDLFAHFGVIYDIQWSLSDTFLLTCSSDGCCKVWKIKSPPADEDDQNLLRMRQAKQMRRRSSLAGIGIQANLAISAFQVKHKIAYFNFYLLKCFLYDQIKGRAFTCGNSCSQSTCLCLFCDI